MRRPPESEAAEATLELTILSIDSHFSHPFLAKQKPSLSAWVDPAHKRSTTSRNCVLHLPLPLRHLQDPNSVLTVQNHAPRLAFKTFRPSASASAPLSSLRLSGDPVTLHLRRPSGRLTASVSLSVRILWSLVPDPILDDCGGFEAEAGLRLEPSAPPLPEPESQPDEKMKDESSALRNFLLGALSGAAAVVLVNVIRRQ
ncbi:uncharacterized protein LOC144553718 [Carex rostrata]